METINWLIAEEVRIEERLRHYQRIADNLAEQLEKVRERQHHIIENAA